VREAVRSLTDDPSRDSCERKLSKPRLKAVPSPAEESRKNFRGCAAVSRGDGWVPQLEERAPEISSNDEVIDQRPAAPWKVGSTSAVGFLDRACRDEWIELDPVGTLEAMKRQHPLLEVCIDSVEGCIAAHDGGADRVELCANLVEGGTTPSAGLLAAARDASAIPIMAMIRPRGGDFLYSKHELAAMRVDVTGAKSAGAHGVVLGILRADGTVDVERVRELADLARPMQVTFHRAFDMTRDLDEALEALIELGIDRVLTSGGEANVIEGLERITALVRAAGDRIAVMPGGGVREDNIRRVIDATGAREVHFTAFSRRPSPMSFRNPRCSMGSSAATSEYEHSFTDVERVRRFAAAVR
jgi:copper homeostasis protein